jgi:flagellar biosynthesis protein FlhB
MAALAANPFRARMSSSEASREDRELPATERRLQRAREQGQVPRSRDLAHLGAAGALLLMMGAGGPWLGHHAIGMVAQALRFDRDAAFASGDLLLRLGGTGLSGLSWVAPVLVLMVALMVAASLALGGWNIASEALEPKFGRLNPLAGIKRILDWRQLLLQLRMALLVTALMGAAWWYLNRFPGTLEHVSRVPLDTGIALGFAWIAGGVAVLLGVCVLSTIIDVPMQLLKHHSDLRMTREEVRRENKETEGDPHMRGERRRRQRELSRGRMMAAVPQADVVVTNPTHYAVALRYDEGTMRAPTIVAMGADHLALRIREIAAASGVPLLEAPPLARALYKHGDLDAEVPVALYGAVAQVLAWVMRLRVAVAPPSAPRIEIPQGLDPAEAA